MVGFVEEDQSAAVETRHRLSIDVLCGVSVNTVCIVGRISWWNALQCLLSMYAIATSVQIYMFSKKQCHTKLPPQLLCL